MGIKTKHFKISPIKADEFQMIVENFCRENKLSECNVKVRKEGFVFFYGNKSYLPLLWNFSLVGTFSLHNSYALISIDLSNGFDQFFNYLTSVIALFILLMVLTGISLPDYTAASPLMQLFWLIIILLESVSFFLQRRLLNSLCRKIPGSIVSLKKREFSKLLED